MKARTTIKEIKVFPIKGQVMTDRTFSEEAEIAHLLVPSVPVAIKSS